MKNLNYLKTFIEITKHSSLTSFAKATNTVHAYAAHVIKEMEREFACQLVRRKQRRIQLSLTAQGKQLVESAPSILENLSDLKKRIRYGTNPAEPILFSLYASRGLCDAIICPNLAKIYHYAPNVKLNIFPRNAFMSHDEKIGVLTLGAFVPESKKDCIKQVHLCDFQQHLWASDAYTVLHGVPQNIKDIHHHHFITNSPSSVLAKELERFKLDPRNISFIESPSGVMRAALGGAGIMSTSIEFIEALGYKGHIQRVLPDLGFTLSVYFSYPVDWHDTPLMNNLVATLKKICNISKSGQ